MMPITATVTRSSVMVNPRLSFRGRRDSGRLGDIIPYTRCRLSKGCAGGCPFLNVAIFRDSPQETSRLGKLLGILALPFGTRFRHFASPLSRHRTLAFAEERRGGKARVWAHSARIVCMITC